MTDNVQDMAVLDGASLLARHYTWKELFVSWMSQRLFGRLKYQVKAPGLDHGMVRRGGLGWARHLFRHKISREQEFLLGLDFGGKTVWDVGSFHGSYAYYFASRGAKQVLAFEPNHKNFLRLIEHISLNRLGSTVVAFEWGLASKRGTASLTYDPLMSGGGSISKEISTGISRSKRYRLQKIILKAADEMVYCMGYKPPQLLKVDVEGAEYQVLMGARRIIREFHPDIFIEMHGETPGDKLRNSGSIMTFLLERGYTVRHVQSNCLITAANAHLAAAGHLYCTRRKGLYSDIKRRHPSAESS